MSPLVCVGKKEDNLGNGRGSGRRIECFGHILVHDLSVLMLWI